MGIKSPFRDVRHSANDFYPRSLKSCHNPPHIETGKGNFLRLDLNSMNYSGYSELIFYYAQMLLWGRAGKAILLLMASNFLASFCSNISNNYTYLN